MLWWIRKHYNLPPTDQRFLDLTEEQISLEWEHYKLDNPELAEKESYHDPNYELWEQESMEKDSKIDLSSTSTEEDWEEVPLEGE